MALRKTNGQSAGKSYSRKAKASAIIPARKAKSSARKGVARASARGGGAAAGSALPPIRRAAVIGLGYVGLPLAVEMALAGYETVGIDVDARKIDAINKGKSYILDVPNEDVVRLVREGRLRATLDFDALREVEAISVCVPTPLRKTKDPDISYIAASVEQIAPRLQPGQLVILESTSYPGTTDEMVLPHLANNGRQVGRDFFLAFSPERVDPANPVWKTRNTPKVVGGVTPACTLRAAEFYGRVFDTIVPVSSTRCAEMVKLLENTFRAVNIGLVNEVAMMCNRLGLDAWEVIDAAATKPFGFMPFYPGPGLGGHCIPIDPVYLSWKLKTLNFTSRFIDLATEINASMPYYVVSRILEALNDAGKPLKGARVVVVGVAYKKNVSDIRESPALDLIHLLRKRGACVDYHDPHVPALREGEIDMKSVALTPARLRACDLAVIATAHDSLDIASIVRHAPLVFDARNATRVQGRRKNIVKL